MPDQKEQQSPHGTPGRQRSTQAHHAILDAALAILLTEGYRAVTIEGIAAKAGVGKQTIYRWWPSKAAIVLEALTAHTASQIVPPDLGSLQADLEAFLQATFQTLERTGLIVRSLMAEAQIDPAFGVAFREHFIVKRRAVLLELLQRGVRRGELPQAVPLEFLVDLLYGAMWYRLLNQHAALDATFARQLTAVMIAHGHAAQ